MHKRYSHDGGARFPEGVHIFLEKLSGGCQISLGAKYPVTPHQCNSASAGPLFALLFSADFTKRSISVKSTPPGCRKTNSSPTPVNTG